MPDVDALRARITTLWPHLDERSRRMLAASEAQQCGRGGVSVVSRLSGLSRVTITKGLQDLREPPLPPGRIRRPGAGRPSLIVQDPEMLDRLEGLVDPLTRGDPDSPLRWTVKSTRTLADELGRAHHPISHEKFAQLLRVSCTTASRAIGRPRRARRTRTATRSSSTSTVR